MKLGVLVEAEEGLDWERWRAICSNVERLGFESVWLADHLSSPWSDQRHGLEPWIALGVAAAQTQHVRFGPLVSPITFRQPALMARMAETIDALGTGRFVLGLGLGWNAQEHARFAIPFPPVVERARLLADGVELIRHVLGDRHIPLLIGGMGPRSTLPLVARHADQWNLTTSSVELYQTRSRQLLDVCREIGRDPATIRRSVALGFLIGRNADELGERSRRLQRVVQPLAAVEPDNVADAARDMGWVAGSPGQIVAALQPLAHAGVDLAILGHYDLADMTALELIASDVMPALA